tara:strand:+ start:308 stop:571 length:264 start_codon:yes stop_codon:yes gene_type:complete
VVTSSSSLGLIELFNSIAQWPVYMIYCKECFGDTPQHPAKDVAYNCAMILKQQQKTGKQDDKAENNSANGGDRRVREQCCIVGFVPR